VRSRHSSNPGGPMSEWVLVDDRRESTVVPFHVLLGRFTSSQKREEATARAHRHEWCARRDDARLAVAGERRRRLRRPAVEKHDRSLRERKCVPGGRTTLGPERRGGGDCNMSEAPVPPVGHLAPEVCTPAVLHVINVMTRVTAVVDSGCPRSGQ